MSDVIKKMFDSGIDMQNKMFDFLGDLAKAEKTEDGEKSDFMKEIHEKLNVSKEKGEKLIDDISDSDLEQTPMATHRDIHDLRDSLNSLCKRIDALEGKKQKAAAPAKEAKSTSKKGK